MSIILWFLALPAMSLCSSTASQIATDRLSSLPWRCQKPASTLTTRLSASSFFIFFAFLMHHQDRLAWWCFYVYTSTYKRWYMCQCLCVDLYSLVPHGGQFLSLEGKLGGQTGDKIMKLTAKKQPTKKTSAKIASKINTWLSGVYEGIFADVMIFFSFALLSDALCYKYW